ncbi:hypothetical protein [Streptomyces cyaneogriseus]|nr:hypothetical protein [Streptomyces cyaneogriseus]
MSAPSGPEAGPGGRRVITSYSIHYTKLYDRPRDDTPPGSRGRPRAGR